MVRADGWQVQFLPTPLLRSNKFVHGFEEVRVKILASFLI